MQTLLVTRFSVHQPEWSARPTEEWLEQRWPLFERTIAAVEKQTLPHRWVLICHEQTPQLWLKRLEQVAEVMLVNEHWLAALQDSMPKGLKLTVRLDSDDLIAPTYLEAIHKAALDSYTLPSFICMTQGYQYDGHNYYLHAEHNGPFLGFVEHGSDTVYCRAHGRALLKERVIEMRERLYIQVIHKNNLKNRLRGQGCEPPAWV